MACEPHAAGMAAQMADFLSNAPTHEQRLHVLYLANDVLLKGYYSTEHTACAALILSYWLVHPPVA